MQVKNYLLGYKDLYIYQDTDMFNFSLDSVLLPNFVTVNSSTKNILDIGCGNAPIPIILSTKTKAKITGVEIQKPVYEMAVKTVLENNLQDQIEIINGDINELAKTYETGIFDLITCNPPFFKYQENSNINDNEYKTIARHEIKLNLDQLMSISKKLLNNNGVIGVVHRPERLIDIITTMRNNNIEPKRVQLVYPHHDAEANILLIEGKKNGKPGLKVLSPLYTHKDNGDYTDEVMKFFVNN